MKTVTIYTDGKDRQGGFDLLKANSLAACAAAANYGSMHRQTVLMVQLRRKV
jgi:hypothetical protein